MLALTITGSVFLYCLIGVIVGSVIDARWKDSEPASIFGGMFWPIAPMLVLGLFIAKPVVSWLTTPRPPKPPKPIVTRKEDPLYLSIGMVEYRLSRLEKHCNIQDEYRQ